MFFQDKVVWVTGASSGIGEGLAYALAKENARVILSARRQEELERVKRGCAADASRVMVLPLDVADLESLPDKARQAHEFFGRVDILINNAGLSMRGYVAETDMAVQQRVMQVNYFGPVALTKAVLPYMLEQHGGHIVVVSSLAAKLAVPGRSAYCASKAALHGFFDSLRPEVYAQGIKVTLVCPGFVNTNITENSLLEDGTPRGARVRGKEFGGMSIDDSARHILNAIARGKEEFDYGGMERFAVPIRRLFPWAYTRALRRVRL